MDTNISQKVSGGKNYTEATIWLKIKLHYYNLIYHSKSFFLCMKCCLYKTWTCIKSDKTDYRGKADSDKFSPDSVHLQCRTAVPTFKKEKACKRITIFGMNECDDIGATLLTYVLELMCNLYNAMNFQNMWKGRSGFKDLLQIISGVKCSSDTEYLCIFGLSILSNYPSNFSSPLPWVNKGSL